MRTRYLLRRLMIMIGYGILYISHLFIPYLLIKNSHHKDPLRCTDTPWILSWYDTPKFSNSSYSPYFEKLSSRISRNDCRSLFDFGVRTRSSKLSRSPESDIESELLSERLASPVFLHTSKNDHVNASTWLCSVMQNLI
jgi:hypothetical protein